MPPTRNILSRRLSSYDTSIFNPPPTLRPAAGRFYSWPRSVPRPSSTRGSPQSDSEARRVTKSTAKKVSIDEHYTSSSDEEEVDQLDDDEADDTDQGEEEEVADVDIPANHQRPHSTPQPPPPAVVRSAARPPPVQEPLRPALRRRANQQADEAAQVDAPKPELAAPSPPGPNDPSSSHGTLAQPGGDVETADEDLGEASVNGPILNRCVIL